MTTLKDQLTQLTRDRDAALAKLADARGMVEKLKSQVQEQTQKVAALQGQRQSAATVDRRAEEGRPRRV